MPQVNPKKDLEESHSLLLNERLIALVREFDLRAKQKVNALLCGDYRSAFRGSGMQFKEFRAYEPGDDVRHIHWGVTARTGRATLKTYEEERELDVLLMVDGSGSSLLGIPDKKKIHMYAELTALLGLAALKTRDNVGLLLFDDQPGQYLPPKNSRNQLLRMLSNILAQPLAGHRSDLVPALQFAEQVLKRRSLVLVLSDFIVPSFKVQWQRISQKHEMILIHCFDDAERGARLKGVYEIWDPENRKFFLLDANSKAAREKLAQDHLLRQHALEEIARNTQSDYLTLSLEDDYLQRLVHFFRRRGPSRL